MRKSLVKLDYDCRWNGNRVDAERVGSFTLARFKVSESAGEMRKLKVVGLDVRTVKVGL